jgi:hypothetical protein
MIATTPRPVKRRRAKLLIATTTKNVKAQVAAMMVNLFEVGAYKPALASSKPIEPEMLLRTWNKEALVRSIDWLRLQNLKGRNIYIRPKGEHPLTLLDDLNIETIEKMKREGFHPAVVVETSAGNFQAWVNHGEDLPKGVSTRAAKVLANRFGADPSSADWRHFGRLAGFTNRKEQHRGDDGLFPFVKLIEASGSVYPRATDFVVELRAACELADRRLKLLHPPRTDQSPENLRTIRDFRQKPEYHNDGNRIDLAYAVYAISRGVPEGEVRAAIKGSPKRQVDYIERTLRKAWARSRDAGNER